MRYERLPQPARSVVGGAGNRDRARVSILPAGYRQADQRKENKYRGPDFIRIFEPAICRTGLFFLFRFVICFHAINENGRPK